MINCTRRITYGIGCVWAMPCMSPLSSLDAVDFRFQVLEFAFPISGIIESRIPEFY